MNQELEILILNTLSYGADTGLNSFINQQNELVVIPRINAWFRLDDVKTAFDFKCKVLNWLSYYCAPNHWDKYWSPKMRDYINCILQTNFSNKDLEFIYGRLGNAVNKELTAEFINSEYDMKLLKGEK